MLNMEEFLDAFNSDQTRLQQEKNKSGYLVKFQSKQI